MARKLFSEFIGTLLLVSVVVGSGAMAQNLTADVGLQLLINALSTIMALGILIELLAPVSGAQLNPVVSLALLFRKESAPATTIGYIVAQVIGAIAGAVIANLMFAHPAIFISHHDRIGFHLLLGEVVATAGLIFIIFTAIGEHKSSKISVLVPAWIGAAYFFTSSTSFANPAVTIGRIFSNTFSGISPKSVLPFVGAQIVGAVIGYIIFTLTIQTEEQ
jgi:glycerol uptake facilitator-like aquaporin